MNYTLTTNLIKDCMALIPQNIDRLNGEQEIFMLWRPVNGNFYYDWENESHSIKFNQCEDYQKFVILSFCLRTIPEFQICSTHKRTKEWGEYVNRTPIISNATLKGYKKDENGDLIPTEYPPSTLDELCESYKQVMSK